MPSTLLAALRLTGVLITALLLNLALLMCPNRIRLRADLTSICFRGLLLICGIRLNCKIPLSELRSGGKTVIVANHVSYLDTIILCALRPCIFLAKLEVAHWPLFGWVARSLGCVFVRRESIMGRANALRQCLKLSSDADIALFPEGTTTSAPLPALKSWAKGHAWIAQRAKAESILCLALIYENQSEAAWTDDMNLMPHLFKTLGRRETKITVTGAWVPVCENVKPSELALTTFEQLCLAARYEYS
jgi:1-acyl-sn-glycerol-3-phosphate acyltransferase